MFLTIELVYALWEEVPKLVYYRLICKTVDTYAAKTHVKDYFSL